MASHDDEISGPGRRRVILRCGTHLYFSTGNLAPRPGELMPCVRHGFCDVDRVDPGLENRRNGLGTKRAPRRTPTELEAHLRQADTFTLGQLRRERFTLRMLSAAAREGLLSIESADDDVIVRSLVYAPAPA